MVKQTRSASECATKIQKYFFWTIYYLQFSYGYVFTVRNGLRYSPNWLASPHFWTLSAMCKYNINYIIPMVDSTFNCVRGHLIWYGCQQNWSWCRCTDTETTHDARTFIFVEGSWCGWGKSTCKSMHISCSVPCHVMYMGNEGSEIDMGISMLYVITYRNWQGYLMEMNQDGLCEYSHAWYEMNMWNGYWK